MRVVDLFCGLKGWSEPFRERGHEVWTTDIDPRFEPDLAVDILEMGPSAFPWKPDIILASPPCETFSVASIGTHWRGGKGAYQPTPKARTGTSLVYATLALIEAIQPTFAVIENPRGVLRNLNILNRWSRVTIWYCRYGETRAKPTDLWGLPFPSNWTPRPGCRNGHPDHDRAPRGAKTGTQGLSNSAQRAEIPLELALDVCLAAERDLAEETAA